MGVALGLVRISGRILATVVAYLVAWRLLAVPTVLMVGVVWWWGRAGVLALVVVLAVAVAFLADHGAGFSLDALMRNASDALERSRRRHQALRIKQRWPALCRELGWDSADGRTPHTSSGRPDETRRQRPRQPALRHVEALGDVLRVVWRPRGDVKPGAWHDHAEALGRQLGAYSVRVAELPGEPGTLAATFGMVPLPVVDAAHGAVVGQPQAPRYGPEVSAVQQPAAGALRLELGQRAGGGVAAWVPAEVNGLLVVGSTGGGKGGALRYLAHQALDAGAVVHVVDPKATGEHGWVTGRGGFVYRDLGAQLACLEALEAELRHRCDDLAALGAASVMDLPERMRPRPILVVVDEAADLLALRKVQAERTRDEQRGRAGALLATLAMQGRAVLVHPVVALQRPDVASLGPAGGVLRAQLVARVAAGTLDAEGMDATFGPGHRERAVSLTGTPGRALAARLAHHDGPDPYPIQVRWMPLSAVTAPQTESEAA